MSRAIWSVRSEKNWVSVEPDLRVSFLVREHHVYTTWPHWSNQVDIQAKWLKYNMETLCATYWSNPVYKTGFSINWGAAPLQGPRCHIHKSLYRECWPPSFHRGNGKGHWDRRTLSPQPLLGRTEESFMRCISRTSVEHGSCRTSQTKQHETTK